MDWYKFKKNKVKGRFRINKAQVAFYDMERNGDCFDESWIINKGDDVETLHNMGMLLPFIELDENADKCDKSRVFIHMDDGGVYELSMRKLSKKQLKECSSFYGGRS